MTRQQKILVGCLVALALAIAYAVWETPEQDVAPREPGARPGAKSVASPAPQDERRLRLELMEPSGNDFPGAERDLFGPLYAAPPPPPPPPPAPPLPKLPPAPTPAPVAPPPQVAFAPPARFTVLGYLEVDDRRVVFLESEGETFLARSGETFGGDFRVVELSPQRLVIEQEGIPRPIVLPLEDDQGGMTSFGSPADTSAGGGTRRSRPARVPGRLY